MKVSNIRLINEQEYCQLQADVKMDALGGREFSLWYRFPVEFESFIDASCGDPFVAALLLPAMVTGEPLEVEAPVSPKLFDALYTIQDIFHCWEDSLTKIPVHVPERSFINNKATPAQAASFFSTGVDSFYTVLKQLKGMERKGAAKRNLTHLVLIRGFDIPNEPAYNVFFERTLANAQVVAKALDKEVLPVATNIREWIQLFVDWGALGHGACLASVGLTLQNLFSEIFIASSYNYNNLFSWGSHPMVDPMWSVENLSIIHDGCEAGRLAKIRFIAQYPIVLETLRVCPQINSNAPNVYLNCGRCSTCLDTMLSLHMAGALKECKVFPQTINLDLVRRVSITPPAMNMAEVYHSLSSSESDQEIKSALKEVFEKYHIVPHAPVVRSAVPYLWHRLHALDREVSAIISPHEKFIFVDQDQLRKNIAAVHQAIPFTEKEGKYWGPPSDDTTAIQEAERLRKEGAAFVVVAWPGFWLLEYHKEWNQYLRSNFPCLLENENLVIFDLRHQLTEKI